MSIIKFVNKQARKYIEEKEQLVLEGRKYSEKIEAVEKKLVSNKAEQNKVMGEIQPKELVARGDALQVEIEKEIDVVRKKFGDKEFAELQGMEKNNILFIVACERARDGSHTILGLVNELGDIVNEIHKQKLAAIPQSLKDEAATLKEEKEELELKRNKNALKVQKIKDRLIPIIKKEVGPKLGEYEDMETAQLHGEKIVVVTYDRLEEFKAGFKKQKK